MFKKDVAQILAKATQKPEHQILSLIEIPDSEYGDYAFPCFTLSKELKKAPNQIAEQLASEISGIRTSGESLFDGVEAKGPYLNFFIRTSEMAKRVMQDSEQINPSESVPTENIVIEFPAPNTNKPLHLGHIRNLLLGESVSRILECLGHKVIRVDLINDRGIHICKSMLAYKKWGDGREPDKKTDHFVGDFYVKYSEAAEKDKGLEDEARQMLLDWESRDEETIELWNKMNEWAISGFKSTYERLGIKHERVYLESEMFEKGKELVRKGLENGLFRKDDDGNVIADLEQYGMPNRVMLRADGTSIYITQDIYLAQKRYEDYDFDKCIYVVANEQDLHFQQLFKILELLGFEQSRNLFHLSYGMIALPEGRMKSREGKIVDADNLFDDLHGLAESEVRKRHQLSAEELDKRSEQIGMAGLKFFVLKYDPKKDFVYNPSESLSFEGETGPYIQYTHARICSILRKHGEKIGQPDYSVLVAEKQVIRILALFSTAVEDAGRHHKPSIVARYLLDLCQCFNEYYHSTPILRADPVLKYARIALADKVREVISRGLYLLGIEAPEAM